MIVDYALLGSYTPMGDRLLNFTVMNGEKCSYDSENPYVTANIPSDGDSIFKDDVSNILEKVGVKSFISMVYDIVMAWLGDLFEFIKGIIK